MSYNLTPRSMLELLDLLGTFAFAITGAFKARGRSFHLAGVVFLGIITAMGGGTIRDLLIGRTPLFYLEDQNYLIAAVIASLLTFLIPKFFKSRYSLFRFIDSLGLAVFVIIGVSISFEHIFTGEVNPSVYSMIVCILLGMLTGFGGGVIRDSIMGDTPFSFMKGSNYATSAFWGSLSFYVLMFWQINVAIIISTLITLTFREIISPYGYYQRRKRLLEIKEG